MNPYRSIFISIILISFLELYVLLVVGSFLGTILTTLLIILSAILGSFLLKQQGVSTWKRFQQVLQKQEVPAYELMEGFLILLGAILLLTPGFISDIIGLIFLVPVSRRKMITYVMQHYFKIVSPQHGTTLEGEFRKET